MQSLVRRGIVLALQRISFILELRDGFVLLDQIVLDLLVLQSSSASWRTLQESWTQNRAFSVTFEVAKHR